MILHYIFSDLGTHSVILERLQLWKTMDVPYDVKVSCTITKQILVFVKIYAFKTYTVPVYLYQEAHILLIVLL